MPISKWISIPELLVDFPDLSKHTVLRWVHDGKITPRAHPAGGYIKPYLLPRKRAHVLATKAMNTNAHRGHMRKRAEAEERRRKARESLLGKRAPAGDKKTEGRGDSLERLRAAGYRAQDNGDHWCFWRVTDTEDTMIYVDNDGALLSSDWISDDPTMHDDGDKLMLAARCLVRNFGDRPDVLAGLLGGKK